MRKFVARRGVQQSSGRTRLGPLALGNGAGKVEFSHVELNGMPDDERDTPAGIRPSAMMISDQFSQEKGRPTRSGPLCVKFARFRNANR